jgi:hypothetical protein
MFGWLFKAARKEARGWNHTNFFNAAKPARRQKNTRRRSHRIRDLQKIIKQKNNEIMQLKRINKAQKPMADSGVSTGTYRLYQAGLKEIAKLTWKQQRLIFTMPEIRTVVEGLLGIPEGSTTKKYAPKKYR